MITATLPASLSATPPNADPRAPSSNTSHVSPAEILPFPRAVSIVNVQPTDRRRGAKGKAVDLTSSTYKKKLSDAEEIKALKEKLKQKSRELRVERRSIGAVRGKGKCQKRKREVSVSDSDGSSSEDEG